MQPTPQTGTPPLTLTPNADVVKKILTRELIIDITKEMKQLDTPFTNGEKLVVMGSAISLLEGTKFPELAPWKRVPTDMDIYFHEPNGENLDDASKKPQQEILINKVLQPVTERLGGQMRHTNGRVEFGSQEFTITKQYSKERIAEIFSRADVKEIMRKNHLTIDLEKLKRIEAPPAEIALQYFMYPCSFCNPVRFHGENAPEPGSKKLDVMRDDSENLIALKLARLCTRRFTYAPSHHMPVRNGRRAPHKSRDRHFEKVTDMIDIFNELNLRDKLHDHPMDMQRLKMLTLAHMSYLQEGYMRVDVNRTNPDVGNNLEQMASDIEQYGKMTHIPPARVREIAMKVDALVQAMFPERGPENRFPTSHTEELFFNGVTTDENAAAQLLKTEAYAGLQKRDPGLAERVPCMYMVRPLDDRLKMFM